MFYDLILNMASCGNTKNLSIIAVRILPHCRDYIRKCLKENTYYYLNTNFDISEDGKTIILRERHLEIINDTFFNHDEIFDDKKLKTRSNHEGKKPTPNISISAIVGKNGDGKSSLIELIIRILNNFAYQKGLNANNHLRYIEGVYGELYYRINGKFYKIRIRKEEGNGENVKFYEYSYDEKESIYRIGEPLTEFNPDETAFYTLVSNYSHFAYNTEEFSEESDSDDVEEHWLHKLFHKNDAYQTPLNLHPYRHKGNIDINRERELSNQRLLASIASSFLKNEGDRAAIAIALPDKLPYQLRLRDIGKSKLQEVTIRKFFEDNRDTNIISSRIKGVENIIMSVNIDMGFGYQLKDNYDGKVSEILFESVKSSLTFLSSSYLTPQFMRFADKALDWIEPRILLNEETDLGQLLEKVTRTNSGNDGSNQVVDNKMTLDYYLNKEVMEKWGKLKKLSVIQFLRLALVFDICKMWNKIGVGVDRKTRLAFNPSDIFKRYEDLSNAEKCCHYIIYKTIEILYTYPSYGDDIKQYSSVSPFFSYRDNLSKGTLFNLTRSFFKLSEDWEKKSHNTLKLRQAFNLLRGRKSSKKLYASAGPYVGKTIVFSKLKEQYIQTLSDIETLPPPIFKWEIIFKRKGEENLIPFNTFSSGEKQKLFFQSAIIYHLQNINSIGAENIHYHSVNLIFEEIELYFHPEWQRTLIFDLMKAIRTANIPEITSINMIFVTHSPYILSDIPKSNVLFLKEGRPNYDMQENTFGANINSLLKNGFFLPSLPMGEFAYRKINTLFEKLHTGNFDNVDLDQIYAQIMTVGEPAIRMQLMTLFAPYNILRRTSEDTIEKLRNFLSKSQT